MTNSRPTTKNQRGQDFKKIIGYCKTERINLTSTFLTFRIEF